MNIGPNVKKLIIHKMSLLMVPPKSDFKHAVNQLIKPGNIGKMWKEAEEWVKEALQLVKDAPDSTYNDDEEIAGIILEKIEEKQKEKT